MSDEQRQAQRALVGFINHAPVELSDDTITWWRDPRLADIVGSATEDVSAWLTTLEVPHRIAIARRRRAGRTTTMTGPSIALADLDHLALWTPSFVEKVRSACS